MKQILKNAARLEWWVILVRFCWLSVVVVWQFRVRPVVREYRWRLWYWVRFESGLVYPSVWQRRFGRRFQRLGYGAFFPFGDIGLLVFFFGMLFIMWWFNR